MDRYRALCHKCHHRESCRRRQPSSENRAIRSGRSPDPPIYGNDIVVVGEDGVQKFLRGSTYLFPVLGRFIPFVF